MLDSKSSQTLDMKGLTCWIDESFGLMCSIKVVNAFDATKLIVGNVPEILDIKEMKKKIWIYGNIIDISGNWFFKSCPTCVRIVEAKGDRFWCNYCNDTIPFALLRYKLDISVVDDTGIVQLLCWDKIARELIGKPCEDLQDDGVYLPIEIDMLTYKAIMFKVSKKKDQIGPYNGSFMVSRITADPILHNRFGPLAIPSQESKAEDVYSPIRDVKAEEVYSSITAVKAE
ncbi:replication protein A 70 kDa DNA-binding subunit [Striga asiatica]|uniref:Replication protein A 70 kDa DNA-binding subunit n=1 Tax=Striga asiatica TaxID=4170 RepID=A0A5A7R3P0_STRAF|nr:replication protein A 70 kDa DNA-binding subunit [Striga asiatica]